MQVALQPHLVSVEISLAGACLCLGREWLRTERRAHGGPPPRPAPPPALLQVKPSVAVLSPRCRGEGRLSPSRGGSGWLWDTSCRRGGQCWSHRLFSGKFGVRCRRGHLRVTSGVLQHPGGAGPGVPSQCDRGCRVCATRKA